MPELSEKLQEKIALFLYMEIQEWEGMRTHDRMARQDFLVDGEVRDWLRAMDRAGKIRNTAYLNAKGVFKTHGA